MLHYTPLHNADRNKIETRRTIHALFPGQGINALDLVLFMRNLGQNSVSFHETYMNLDEQMKDEVEAAFYRRRGDSSPTATTRQEFASEDFAMMDQPERICFSETPACGVWNKSRLTDIVLFTWPKFSFRICRFFTSIL